MILKQVLALAFMWSFTVLLLIFYYNPYPDKQDPRKINPYSCLFEFDKDWKSVIVEDRIFFPEKLRKLEQFVFSTNTLQYIINNEKFSNDDIELVIVVQVHDRRWYLEHLIESLSRSPQINKTLLIFSHDIYDEDINSAILRIDFARVMQIFYPCSIQIHPDGFPGQDSVTCAPPCSEKARNATLAQIKHHWWWKINFVFKKILLLEHYQGLVLLLEEDHYVSPDFVYFLKMMEEYSKSECPECWFFALAMAPSSNFNTDLDCSNCVTIRNTIENLGLAFNRSIWEKILQEAKYFCTYNDYNWDWTLRYIISKVVEPTPLSMIATQDRILHLGLCGIHSTKANCYSSNMIEFFNQAQNDLFPKFLGALREQHVFDISRNGGWNDSRDHTLCMLIST